MPFFRRRVPAHPDPLWRRYLRFLGPDVDADVDDELRFHLDMSAADLERRGHSRDEAERLALERFGELGEVRRWMGKHDRQRERRRGRGDTMDAVVSDLRYAVRRLRRQGGFTLTVILVLGLGIGAATAMFSAVDAALLRPLPFQRDDRLVTLARISVPVREFSGPQRSAEITDARAMRSLFTHVAAYAPGGLNLTDVNAPLRLKVALVTTDLFATLGVSTARGRGFTAEEGVPDGPRAAVLSDGLWRRQFGSDTTVLGRDIRLNDVPYRIVGVMPRNFRFPQETDVWLPLTVPSTIGQYEAFRGWMPTTIVARLATGVTTNRAESGVATLIRTLQSAGERAQPLERPIVKPLRDALVGERRTALLVLMGATALVLLLACVNVTNLMLSRTLTQRRELAVRAALGAGRGRLLQQLLTESVVLAMAGGIVGVTLAYGGVGTLAMLMPPDLSGTALARVDARVLAFSTVTALLAGLVAGFWPALRGSRTIPGETTNGGVLGGAPDRDGAWARRTFVVAEIALALVLTVGAGLMLHSLRALLTTDAGVRPQSVATLELTLPSASYPSGADQRRFFEDVVARIRAVPGVRQAAVVNELPLRGKPSIAVTVEAEGRRNAPGTEPLFAQLLQTTPGYFETLGIPLLRGRTFAEPMDSTRPLEVIVNESLARRLWPGEEAVGKRLMSVFRGSPPLVVGVVGDVRGVSLESQRSPQMYFSLVGTPAANAALLARGDLKPRMLAMRMRDAVRSVDPALAVYNVRPMTEVIAGAIAPRRANTALITLFGAVALGLAAVGVYGVIAYGVSRRTREIGIRVALGAQPTDVVGLVAREGITLAVIGIAAGLTGAWAARRSLAGLMYGVTPDDPIAYGGAAAVLLTVALVATLLPALQALRVDPVTAIRTE